MVNAPSPRPYMRQSTLPCAMMDAGVVVVSIVFDSPRFIKMDGMVPVRKVPLKSSVFRLLSVLNELGMVPVR